MGNVVTASALPDDTIFTHLGKMLWETLIFFWDGEGVLSEWAVANRESHYPPGLG